MAHTTPHDLMNAHKMEIHMQLDGAHGEAVVSHLKSAMSMMTDNSGCSLLDTICGRDTGFGQPPLHVKAVTKEGMSQRTRYFERATVLVRYAVLKLIVTVQWVATTAMMADFFTKASDEETYIRCRAVIMNIEEDRKWFPSTRTSVKLRTQRLMAAITRAVEEMD